MLSAAILMLVGGTAYGEAPDGTPEVSGVVRAGAGGQGKRHDRSLYLLGPTRLPGTEPRTAPDGSALVGTPFGAQRKEITVEAADLGPKGTLAFWFAMDYELRNGDDSRTLIESEALQVVARERESFTQLILTFGPEMTGGRKANARIQGLLTHLKRERWYHVAFTWDAEERDNHFILDGLNQGMPEPRAPAGVITGASEDVVLTVGSNHAAMSMPIIKPVQVSPASVMAAMERHGHERYDDEGVNYTDETLRSEDIEGKRLVYSTGFEDEAVLGEWVREGGESASIEEGRLRLTAGPSAEEGQHIVFWLKEGLPANFLAEWKFRPYDKENGLTIVFFNARGVNGESIFDPGLAPRDGTFVQYTKGDLDSYHISYYAGHRGSVNLRKNQGFYLTAIGREYVHDAPPETFHTITLLKEGGKIRLAVDGKVSLKCDDDGETYGPVHEHGGWFGLRQMFQAWYTEYDDLRVWALGE